MHSIEAAYDPTAKGTYYAAYNAAYVVHKHGKHYLPFFKQKFEELKEARLKERERMKEKFIAADLEESMLMEAVHDMLGIEYDEPKEIYERKLEVIREDWNIEEDMNTDQKDTDVSSFSTKERIYRVFNILLCKLSPREERVLRMRSGIGRNMEINSALTLEEVGALFQISRECAKTIEAKALEKLEGMVNMFHDDDTFEFEI